MAKATTAAKSHPLEDFCDELIDLCQMWVGAEYTTRDGIHTYLHTALACSETYYSANSWNNYEPEVRCESAVIGYTDGRCDHVVIAPHGKDSHCFVLDEQQLDDYIYTLQVYRKYMGKLQP